MPEIENDHVVETPEEARAGVTGHGARYVLTVSTVGAAVCVLAVLTWFFL
jgi:hypothetical protein